MKVALVHCNIVNNDYQQDSIVLYTFVPNKPFSSLLESSPTNYIFNSKFQTTEVWIKDQNSQPLEIEDRIKLTLVLKKNIHYTTRYSMEPRDSMYVKGHGFFFLKTWVKI